MYDSTVVIPRLTKHVLNLMDYEDYLLRGVGNTVMLMQHMTETKHVDADIKWDSAVSIHESRIMEAWAINLERRHLYDDIRNLEETTTGKA